MFTATMYLVLSATERADLEHVVRSTSAAAGIVQRARCVLLLTDGQSYGAIGMRLGVSDRFIARWKRRYLAGGVLALADAPRAGRQDHRLTPALEARILHRTRYTAPPASLTHWTSSRMAARVGVSPSTVQRVWHRAGLQPHRLERYVTSPDPDFDAKAADLIGLYLDLPQHAVVLAMDEKTAIQALDRHDPVLPLSPGAPSGTASSTSRHGTLSLYAAVEVGTGRVDGMTAPRYTAVEFLTFLDQLVRRYRRRRRAMHVILDNLSAHETAAVQA